MKQKCEGRSVIVYPDAKAALLVWLMERRCTLRTQRAMGHKSPASMVAYLDTDERDIDALMLALYARMV